MKKKFKKKEGDGEVVGQVDFRRSLGLSFRQHVAEGHIGEKDEAFEISMCLGSGALRVHFKGSKSKTLEDGQVAFEGQYYVSVEDLCQAAYKVELARRQEKP